VTWSLPTTLTRATTCKFAVKFLLCSILSRLSYVFPGLGLGAILAKASRVTDGMVYTSAAALAGCLNREELQMGLIYPKIQRVRDASVVVAREVMKAARREGVSTLPEETWVEWEEWGDVALTAWIKKQVYDPEF
jgi:malate dehydrogenase (oxaloacetate-decarboxylating)(NADP+)